MADKRCQNEMRGQEDANDNFVHDEKVHQRAVMSNSWLKSSGGKKRGKGVCDWLIISIFFGVHAADDDDDSPHHRIQMDAENRNCNHHASTPFVLGDHDDDDDDLKERKRGERFSKKTNWMTRVGERWFWSVFPPVASRNNAIVCYHYVLSSCYHHLSLFFLCHIQSLKWDSMIWNVIF